MTIGPENPDTPETPDEPNRPNQPGQPMPGPPQGMPMPGPPQGMPMQSPPMRPEDEKLWAIAAHLGPIVIGFIAPLVVWLVYKDRSAFIDRQAKEALNMQISYTIYFLVATISILALIGFLLLPIVGIAWVVLMIIATIKAANFEDYRYPLIFRFIS